MRNAQKRPPREILTAKQRAFVVAVVSGMSAHRAAIEAGYKPSRSTGTVLMRKPQIAAAINAARAVQATEAGWTQADVLAELKSLAWSNVSHYYVDENGILATTESAPPNAMAAVSAIKYTTRWEREGDEAVKVTTCEFRLWDKPGALKLAGRHVGLFPERIPDDRVEQAAAKMLQASVDKARRELEARAIDVTATEVPG
jgi:phage terminase small subunit